MCMFTGEKKCARNVMYNSCLKLYTILYEKIKNVWNVKIFCCTCREREMCCLLEAKLGNNISTVLDTVGTSRVPTEEPYLQGK